MIDGDKAIIIKYHILEIPKVRQVREARIRTSVPKDNYI